MVKRLCVSSAVEVAVSPDALSLMPVLFSPAHPSLFFYLNHIFFPHVCPFSCFHISYFTTPSRTTTQHPSPHRFFWLPFSRVSFHHFLLLTMFAWRGKLNFPSPSRRCPLPLISQIVPLSLLCSYNVDIILKNPIDLSRHEKVVYWQCLWFPEVRACGETRAAAFLDIVLLLSGTTEP